MGKKNRRSKPEEPKARCPKCGKLQKVIHSHRTKPFPEDTNICKTCGLQFPRWMGVDNDAENQRRAS